MIPEKHDLSHDPLVAAWGGICVTCTCGEIILESPDEIVPLDELVDAAWRHQEDE